MDKNKLQLEYALIGALVVYGPTIPKNELEEHHFSKRETFELYNLAFDFRNEVDIKREINELKDLGKQVDEFVLFGAWLEGKGLYRKYIADIQLSSINTAPPSIIPFLVKQLKKTTSAQKLAELLKKLKDGKTDIEEILPEIEKAVNEVKEAESEENLRKIDIRQFISMPPEKIEFVVNALPKASVGMIASMGGLGKSMLVLEIAAGITTGTDITEGAINIHKTGKCTYLNLEDPDQILHYRIYNLIHFLPPEKRALMVENLSIYTQKSIFELIDNAGNVNHKNVSQLKKIAEGQTLVIVDTLRRVHSAEEKSDDKMATLLQIFEIVAKETGASFLLIHHVGKMLNNPSRGSSVLYDNIRYQLNLEEVSKKEAQNLGLSNPRKLVKAVNRKANYGKPEEDKILVRVDHGVLKLFEAVEAVEF